MAGPVMQSRRSRSNCRCAEPCYWCGEQVDDHHDHDHFPLPHRHGGNHTVPSCQRCHSLKDRYPITRWAPAAQASIEAGMPLEAQYAIGMLAGVVQGDEIEIGDVAATAELVARLVRTCTTPEARIALAISFNYALDFERRAVRRAPRSSRKGPS